VITLLGALSTHGAWAQEERVDRTGKRHKDAGLNTILHLKNVHSK
jgi:hypothetical protein